MALGLDLKKQTQYLFVPSLDEEAANKSSYIKQIVSVSNELNPFQILKETVGEGIKVIGIETKEASLFQREQLTHFFSDFEYNDIGDFIST
ncbi:aminopeptidase P family N-terminal domain-containing protein [Pseudobacillus sp. 179-B 2D1 NHS]|uniref:aminopeptidase P family N-terminal domain-containing protein n=1 Tax=Pseudobacillus sp. 179-B 2D1 NHS TaxID=3374292 RepID=UPI003878FBF5